MLTDTLFLSGSSVNTDARVRKHESGYSSSEIRFVTFRSDFSSQRLVGRGGEAGGRGAAAARAARRSRHAGRPATLSPLA